jgi:putative DNA primase/helicase
MSSYTPEVKPECLPAALDYLQSGWSVLANCPHDHVGVDWVSKGCGSPGKRPWHRWKEFQERLPTEDEIRNFWRRLPSSNVGVALGPVSGIVRLDVDGPGGEKLLEEWSGGDLPPTLEFTSGRPNGGRGLLYSIPAGVVFQTTADIPARKEELRFQAKGAQTVLPPSWHPGGTRYQWVAGRGPSDITVAPAPGWMVARWGAHGNGTAGQHRRQEPLGEDEPINDGSRNTRLISLAGTMRRRGMAYEEIAAALLVTNERRCRPPLGDEVVRKIATSVCRYKPTDTILIGVWLTGRLPKGGAPAAGGTARLTDVGNARRLVGLFGEDLRHCHPWKRDLVWTGTHWREDDTGQAERWAKETAEVIFAEAAAEANEEKRAVLTKHALKSEGAAHIGAMAALARSEPGVPVLPGDMDCDPFLFNVLNGTVNLRTGQLRPHRREDLLTKLAPVAYDPDATCPLWERSLRRWMDDNEDLIAYLRRVVGYGLTGDVSEQCLWFFHGNGANGKSTFLGTVLALVGDYGMQAVPDLLMTKHNETHPTERADLFGRRFVATIETEEGKRMAEALMKQLTGGDRVRARRMRQDFFEFPPTHKIVLAANHKPQVRDTGHAAWRRIKLVPFTVTIPEEEKDKALPEKLRAELPGILAWAVTGCLEWQEHGLGEPDEVRQATAAYQREQDIICTFIAECCVRHEEARVKVAALFEAYGKWSGDKFMTQPAFNERLRAKGYESKRRGTGYFWHGLMLDQGGDTGGASEPE